MAAGDAREVAVGPAARHSTARLARLARLASYPDGGRGRHEPDVDATPRLERCRRPVGSHGLHAAPSAAPAASAVALRVSGSFQLQNIMLMVSDECGGTDRELAMLRTSDIELRIAQHGTRRALRFSVGALRVEDRLQKSADPATAARTLRLLDSNPPDRLGGHTPRVTSNDQLVRLHYVSGGSGADTMTLCFNRLHVEWNPTTIAALLAFVRRPDGDHGATAAPAAAAEEEEEEEERPRWRRRRQMRRGGGWRGRRRSALTVKAELQALSVSLNTDGSGERLALLAMQQLQVDTLLEPDGGMRVSGQLGNLTAQDTFTVPSAPYECWGCVRPSSRCSRLSTSRRATRRARRLARAPSTTR